MPPEASADEILASIASLAERAARAGEDAARWREVREALAAIQDDLGHANRETTASHVSLLELQRHAATQADIAGLGKQSFALHSQTHTLLGRLPPLRAGHTDAPDSLTPRGVEPGDIPDTTNISEEMTPMTCTFAQVDIPVRGHAQCGLDAQKPRTREKVEYDDLPEPEGVTEDVDAFYVIASGSSMVPEGIQPGDYCLVSPNTPPVPGQRLWLEDGNGLQRIKRLMEITETAFILRGWGEPDSGRVSSVNETDQREFIVRSGPVLAVFRGSPIAGQTVEVVVDPRRSL